MQPLQRLAICNEASSQIVEQFRMSGLVPLNSEIAFSSHQRLAEMPTPDAVHNDPRRQSTAFCEDVVGELKAAGALLESCIALGKDSQKLTRSQRPGIGNVPMRKNVHIVRHTRPYVHLCQIWIGTVNPDSGIEYGLCKRKIGSCWATVSRCDR